MTSDRPRDMSKTSPRGLYWRGPVLFMAETGLENMAQDVKEILKDTVSIGEVVERLGLPLKPHGGALLGDCPTGHESKGGKCFGVNLKENFYNCFHCGEAGDIFSLVEMVKNIDFKEALRWIAQEFRPDLLPQIEKHKGDQDPRLKEYYEKAAFYEVIFEHGMRLLYGPEGKDALAYLVDRRGYTVESLKQTDWIYYPPDKELRAVLLKERPESKDQIKNLKLHGYFGDHFRLAFPYRDRRGAITGFVFRATEPQGVTVKTYDGKTHHGVRYDSIGGTEKYDLFNLHSCKGFNELLIVEGYPDALYLPTIGLKNVVAVGQGLLSKTHIEGLQSFNVRSVTLSFDNDPVKIDEKTGKEVYTGVENTEKALDLLRGSGIAALVIDPFSLAPYKDPDELVKARGVEAFRNLLDNAESGVKWKAKRILSRHNTETDRGFQEALREIEAYQAALAPIDRGTLRATVRVALGISEDTLQEHFTDYNERKAREREEKGYRDLLKEGTRLLEEGHIADLRELLDERLPDLRVKGMTRDITPYTLSHLLEDIRQTPEGLKTGYESLDELITIPQGAITIVAGRPSHGKTTFLLNLFLKMIETHPDRTFLFFSYEESKRQLGLKIINILSGECIDPKQSLVQLENYVRGDNTKRQPIETGKARFKKLTESGRLWVIDEPYFIDDLADAITYLNETHNIGAVFIDYVQKVKIKGKYSTRQIELQKVSERILETAKALSLPVLLGAQLGRDPNQKDKVRLDNLREAGDIEQDANLVLGLFNEAMQKAQDKHVTLKESKVDLRVTILKNRNGVVNEDVTLSFDRPILTITEKEKEPWS